MHRRESLGTITTGGELGRVPALHFIYECDVMLSEPLDFSVTVEGRRQVIPIIGGSFEGPDVKGQVLSIGADWNSTRGDGGSSVEAVYYLRTDDGAILRVVNKGVGGASRPEPARGSERFFMFTTPSFQAPSGKYDWFNRSVFVGTLGARPDAKNAALIRVYRVT